MKDAGTVESVKGECTVKLYLACKCEALET